MLYLAPACAGVAIKRCGRWKSNAFMRYTSVPLVAVCDVFAKYMDSLPTAVGPQPCQWVLHGFSAVTEP